MSIIPDVIYRRRNIKLLERPTGYQARAFRGKHADGEIMTGRTAEEAVMAVKAFLDKQDAELLSRRGPNGFPCADEFRIALGQVKMNKAQEAMLLAHLRAPSYILTATQLAQAAGYKDYNVANRQYGQLAHDVAHELEWTPAETSNGEVTWTFTLADDADKGARESGVEVAGHWRWVLRPEVVEAMS